jgi:hypothetical protein
MLTTSDPEPGSLIANAPTHSPLISCAWVSVIEPSEFSIYAQKKKKEHNRSAAYYE